MIKMYDIQSPISYTTIGNRRDFGHTIQFNLTAWADLNADDWKITYMRPGESATYPVPDGDVSVADNILTWTISEAVTAINGTGSVVIEAYRGGEILKHSDRIMTVIGDGHEPAGEAPDPVADWIEDATSKLAEVDESLESANAAEDLRNSAETARKEAEALRVAAEATRMGFKPMGAYNPANENKYGEWYTHEGGSYGYIWPEPSTGVSLTETSHWQQIATQGPKGDKGDMGGSQTAILPNVYLFGDNFDMPNWNDKSDERMAEMSYRSKEVNFDTFVKIKPQGTSSMGYPKKNLTIKMYSDDAYLTGKKVEMKEGWGEQNKYCLKADWVDPTHSSNVVSAQLAGKMQAQYGVLPDAPNGGLIDGFPVAVYQNGVYQGIYNWNIPKDGWQFGFTKADEDTALLICNEGQTGTSAFQELATGFDDYTWSVEFGNDDADALAALNRVIGFVKDSSDEDFRAHFTEYIDLDSALNYYTFAYLSAACDNLGKNMLFVTKDRQIWYPSLYDLDSLWGIDFSGLPTIPYDFPVPEWCQCSTSVLWAKLERCFANELATRYFELRNGVLSTASIMDAFSGYIRKLPQDLVAEEAVTWPGMTNMGGSLAFMSDFITNRAMYVDYKMRNLFTVDPQMYGTKIYDLPEPAIGDGSTFSVKTGIKLFDNIYKNWTLLLKIPNTNITEGYRILAACEWDSAGVMRGLQIKREYTDSNETFIRVGNNSVCRAAASALPESVFAIVKRRSYYKIYRDGVVVGEVPPSDLPTSYLGQLYLLSSGSANETWQQSSGAISNCLIYKQALGDAEVIGITNSLIE